ncbi:MAG: MerR family DNA-binding transcriptional regulator [Alphaproteobacteria bacterium]|nr:MerR family DNA-binding transcriptional regulator [Alphaproteobacteria bacterium]
MSDTKLTIRQMCDLFDVTPRTLRFYEAKELLFPERIGQKRLFTKRDQARMKLILRGKRFGFSLEDIRQLLALYHVGNNQNIQIKRTLKLANLRLQDMIERRDELNSAISDLKSQIAEGEAVLADVKAKQAAE